MHMVVSNATNAKPNSLCATTIMGTRKNLNGLPNSLEQRYFSTLFYWNGGYMADWIWNAANEKKVRDIEIDILNESVEPKVLQIRPIISQLPKIRDTIQTTLKSHNFPDDFITAAKFIIYISQKHKASTGYLSRRYNRQRREEIFRENLHRADLEDPYHVFPHSLIQKIKKIAGL